MSKAAFGEDESIISFGAKLTEARSVARITQAELSKRSGVSQSHISQLEGGTLEPRLNTILTLAKALGIEPAQLLPTPAGSKGDKRKGSVAKGRTVVVE